jgi:hypothetical protein
LLLSLVAIASCTIAAAPLLQAAWRSHGTHAPRSRDIHLHSGRCRFHASALVCQLVRCACDPGHRGEATPLVLDAVVEQGLLPRVAQLALSSPNCSCMHTAFLEAFSGHTLPHMPRAVWQPLLEDNFGLPRDAGGAKPLPPLPELLLQHGATRGLGGCCRVFHVCK